MSSLYAPSFHRYGQVTLWDVYRQQWTRVYAKYALQCPRLGPTLSRKDRVNLAGHAARWTARAQNLTEAEVRAAVRAARREAAV